MLSLFCLWMPRHCSSKIIKLKFFVLFFNTFFIAMLCVLIWTKSSLNWQLDTFMDDIFKCLKFTCAVLELFYFLSPNIPFESLVSCYRQGMGEAIWKKEKHSGNRFILNDAYISFLSMWSMTVILNIYRHNSWIFIVIIHEYSLDWCTVRVGRSVNT